MKTTNTTRKIFTLIAGVALLASGSAYAQLAAPPNLAGSVIFQTDINGSAPFASDGYSVLMFSNTGTTLSRLSITNNSFTSGTYSYMPTGADARFNFTDSKLRQFNADYTFIDQTDGNYSWNQTTSGGTQNGTFTFCSGSAPKALAGITFTGQEIDGAGEDVASFPIGVSLSFAAKQVTTSGGAGNGTKPYSYVLLNRSTGRIVIDNNPQDVVYAFFSVSGTNWFAQHDQYGGWSVGTFTVLDSVPPSITITAPTPSQHWSNAVFPATGKAGDNWGVSNVFYSVNNGDWAIATTTNNWTNWSAEVTLTPGTNRITAYAVDTAGNQSSNVTRQVVYVLSAPISINIVGNGAVNGAVNGRLLPIGTNVILTATSGAGYRLTNWLVQVDGVTVLSTNKPTPFIMRSNLVLTATFVDVVRPTCTIVSPTASASHLTNGLVTVQVRATDNVGVGNVEFYLNGQDFGPGLGLGSNLWSMDFALATGANTVNAVATDFANNSTTNTIRLVYANTQTKANIITMAERHLETDLPAPPGIYNFFIQDTGVLNASLTVPALQSMSADTWSNLFLTVSFGDLSFAGSLLEADVLTTNQAVFNLPYTYGVRLTVARSANTLLLAARISDLPYRGDGNHVYLYTNYWYADGPPPTLGPFQDQQPFNLSIQDGGTSETYGNVMQTIYITGKITETHSAQTGETHLAQVTGVGDYIPPAISITAPVNRQAWSNSVFCVSGTAKDNVGVSSVWWQLNNSGWNLASTTNNWTNWTYCATLTPGTNTVSAYAVDTSGNFSPTNTVQLDYILSAPLTVQIVGEGTLTPNYNGQLLAIGTTHTMKAAGTNGCAFYYWSGGVPMSANATLTFTMASNLTIIANFKDMTLPVKPTITFPTANQKWSNSVITVTGKTSDNVGVAKVWVQINDGGWSAAGTLNGFTNWSAANLSVSFGTNIVQACAVDAAGNVSLTNAIKFIGVVVPPFVAPTSLAGYAAAAKPSGGKPNIAITWDDSTWAQTGTGNDTNVKDYRAGSYTYILTGTNTALLTNVDLGMMSALGTTNVTTVDLTFTSATTANYAWSSESDSSSGTMTFSHVSNLVPPSLAGHTLHIYQGNGAVIGVITLESDGTFTISKPNGGTYYGTYTFTRYSPTVAILQLNHTDPDEAGALENIELTFTSSTAGQAFGSYYGDPTYGSNPEAGDTGLGTFLLK